MKLPDRVGSITYTISGDGPHSGHQAEAAGKVRRFEPRGDGTYALEVSLDVIRCDCGEMFAIEPGAGSLTATIRP